MTNFEIAETFYNSIFNSHFGHRSIRNEYAFVFSPQGDVPPVDMGRVVNHFAVSGDLRGAFRELLNAYAFNIPFEDLDRDVACIEGAIARHLQPQFDVTRPGLELQVLEHHFFRNKASYIVGRLYVDGDQMPFVLPLLHNDSADKPAVRRRLFVWPGSGELVVLLHAKLFHGRRISAVAVCAVPATTDAEKGNLRDLQRDRPLPSWQNLFLQDLDAACAVYKRSIHRGAGY